MDGVASATLQSPSDAATPNVEHATDPAVDSLVTYLRSAPYPCESPELMQAKLDAILAKVVTCATTSDWKGLTSWMSMLQWYA